MRHLPGFAPANHRDFLEELTRSREDGINRQIKILIEKKGKIGKKGDQIKREINLSFFQHMVHLKFAQNPTYLRKDLMVTREKFHKMPVKCMLII